MSACHKLDDVEVDDVGSSSLPSDDLSAFDPYSEYSFSSAYDGSLVDPLTDTSIPRSAQAEEIFSLFDENRGIPDVGTSFLGANAFSEYNANADIFNPHSFRFNSDPMISGATNNGNSSTHLVEPWIQQMSSTQRAITHCCQEWLCQTQVPSVFVSGHQTGTIPFMSTRMGDPMFLDENFQPQFETHILDESDSQAPGITSHSIQSMTPRVLQEHFEHSSKTNEDLDTNMPDWMQQSWAKITPMKSRTPVGVVPGSLDDFPPEWQPIAASTGQNFAVTPPTNGLSPKTPVLQGSHIETAQRDDRDLDFGVPKFSITHRNLKPKPGRQGAPETAKGQGPVVTPRGIVRKLTVGGKAMAAKVRKVGSCALCSINKEKCSPGNPWGGPCDRCVIKLHAQQNPQLAKHICLRNGLKDFRQTIPDIYNTAGRSLPTELFGSSRKLLIGDRIMTKGKDSVFFPADVKIIVQVRDIDYEPNTTVVWGEGSKKEQVPNYAIADNTLPSVDHLDRWGRNLIKTKLRQLSDFELFSMDDFLLSYCDHKPALPLYHLVDLTLRMVSLSTWLAEQHPITFLENAEEVTGFPKSILDIDDERIQRRLSFVAREQLLLQAAKGMEQTEIAMLSAFDSSLKTDLPSPSDAVIIGLCLRRLSLLYRRVIKRYRKFRDNPARLIQRIEKPKAMYDALTTGYSIVYRGSSSPLSTQWRMEDHHDAFGKDQRLETLFEKLIIEEKDFNEQNRDDEDDKHFTKLFLDRRERKGPRPQVSAR